MQATPIWARACPWVGSASRQPPAEQARGAGGAGEEEQDRRRRQQDRAPRQPLPRHADRPSHDADVGRMDQHQRARQHEYPAPEGQARRGDDAGDVAALQPGGGVDAVARRPAGQQREAEIVAERVAAEGRQRRRPPRQGPPDDPQRDIVVEGERNVARRRQRQRRRQPPAGDQMHGMADVLQPYFRQQAVQRHQPQRRHRQRDGDRQRRFPGLDPLYQDHIVSPLSI